MEFDLSTEEKKELLTLARNTIKAKLENSKMPEPENKGNLAKECGAFVTLHKNGDLRGCIGYMTGIKPLADTIRDMAKAAAFEDPRFPPLSKNEFDEIDIEISVLSPLEKITDIKKIIPGKHGILLRMGMRSGTLLPQVASENNWDRNTFLMHTCYKAGLPQKAWELPGGELYIYTAVIFGEK